MACNRAIHAGDFAQAGNIITDLAQCFRIDAIAWQIEMLTAAVDAHEPGQFPLADELVAAALDHDNMQQAEQALALQSRIAERLDQPALFRSVELQRAVVAEWSKAAAAAQRAALRLYQNPSDRDARLIVATYLCFIKGDWRTGLPTLAHARDETLRELATSEMHAMSSSAQQIINVADQWQELAQTYDGLATRRIMQHAEELYRIAYPTVTGLARLKLEDRMRSKPLFIFDSSNPPDQHWIDEHLHFWANHGREGSGSWANVMVENGCAVLMANRAGHIETREEFPPQGVTHYQIEAQLSSDLLTGTALEFGGFRMYFGNEGGIHFEGGWVPNVIYPVRAGRDYTLLIDLAPTSISLTLNGVHLGTMRPRVSRRARSSCAAGKDTFSADGLRCGMSENDAMILCAPRARPRVC
ncbi:MAG: hypothetical protein ACR2GY_05200 [Phycisphaerales bacterium]